MAGCGESAPPPNPGTGAKQVASDFYDAIVKQDWNRSYNLIDAEGKKRQTPAQFAQIAAAYRKNLGFNPDESHIQTCDEKGSEAIARVVFIGRAANKSKRFTDGVILRKSGESWRVVLPTGFGRKTPS